MFHLTILTTIQYPIVLHVGIYKIYIGGSHHYPIVLKIYIGGSHPIVLHVGIYKIYVGGVISLEKIFERKPLSNSTTCWNI